MILDTAEEIAAARAAGQPVADPAKLEKMLKAIMPVIETEAAKAGARNTDMMMLVCNITRIYLRRIGNPQWTKENWAFHHAVFLNTLDHCLRRDPARRLP